MRRVELVVAVIVLVALLLKMVLHIPGVNVILVIALSTLALVYLPGAAYFLADTKKERNTGLLVIAGIMMGMASIGIMFRVMYWPGGKAMLHLPTLGLPILIAIVFYLKGRSELDAQPFYNKLLSRLVVYAAIVLPLYFVSTKDLLTLQYPNDPEIVRIKNNHFTHPQNKAYTEEYKKMQDSLRRNN